MTATPTLAEVKSQFDHWRNNKVQVNEKVPATLWNLVKEVSKQHSPTEIRKTLGIDNKQWKRHTGTLPRKAVSRVKDSFMEIPPRAPSPQCEIHCNLHTIAVRITLPIDHLQTALGILQAGC